MPHASSDPLLRHVPATVHGRFLVQPPSAAAREARLWFVGFHGQGQSAEAMLPAFARVPGSDRWLVASVQALHAYYAGRTNEVVASWMTRQDRELAIADNVAYIDAVLDSMQREFGAPRAVVFAGFSQGVAMAYRAGLLGRHTCAGIVSAGGDVPPELVGDRSRVWPRVLAATGSRDAYYTPARLEQDLAFLRTRRPDVSHLVFEGGHEWSDALCDAAAAFLAAIEADSIRERG